MTTDKNVITNKDFKPLFWKNNTQDKLQALYFRKKHKQARQIVT